MSSQNQNPGQSPSNPSNPQQGQQGGDNKQNQGDNNKPATSPQQK